MRFINRFYAPSISVMVRGEAGTTSTITLKQGEGSVTLEEHAMLLKCEAIRDFVKDGYLSFPTCPDFRAIEGENEAARRDRERQLWGEQEDRKNLVPEDLSALTALVGEQANELAETKAVNATLLARLEALEAAQKASNSPPPAPTPPPAPAPAPIAPPVDQAPAQAPAAPPPPATKEPKTPPPPPPASDASKTPPPPKD